MLKDQKQIPQSLLRLALSMEKAHRWGRQLHRTASSTLKVQILIGQLGVSRPSDWLKSAHLAVTVIKWVHKS